MIFCTITSIFTTKSVKIRPQIAEKHVTESLNFKKIVIGAYRRALRQARFSSDRSAPPLQVIFCTVDFRLTIYPCRLRVELQSTTEDIKKLRVVKSENDRKHFLAKEEHQAELTRQKKAYSDLERTFNSQVSDLKLKLKSQQEQQALLLQNFSELRRELTNK